MANIKNGKARVESMLLNLQRKIYLSTVYLKYFVKNDWTFHNENTMSLRNYLTPEDMAIFGFPVVLPNSADYFQSALIGAKMYLLKEDMNQLHKAKVHYNRMQRIDIICKILFTVMVLWYIYSYYFSG